MEQALPKALIDFADFEKLDIRVGVILDAQLHPNADKLLVLTVDTGDETPRTICAGVKAFYPNFGGLIKKRILVVVNLKPRNMRGIESQGMLLAASNNDHSLLGLVTVDPVAPTKSDGEQVLADGGFKVS